jgi:hypothetical protein
MRKKNGRHKRILQITLKKPGSNEKGILMLLETSKKG